MNKDVLGGHLFLFLNRRRDRIKLLWWDRDGLAMGMKRLDAGTFETPKSAPHQSCLELDPTNWIRPSWPCCSAACPGRASNAASDLRL
jgi:transposase